MKDKYKKELLLLIKMRITVQKQHDKYKNKSETYISEKTRKKLIKLIEIKEERENKLTNKINSLVKELNVNSKDLICLNNYGMTFKEMENFKGKNKKDWGTLIEGALLVFHKDECY